MDDFRQSLAALTAADLRFINPAGLPTATNHAPNMPPGAPLLPVADATAKPPRKPRQRRRIHKEPDGNETLPDETRNHTEDIVSVGAVPSVNPNQSPIAGSAVTTDPAVRISDKPILSEGHSINAEAASVRADTGNDNATDAGSKRRTRTAVPREWPAVGTKLSAAYFGQTYTAEIVAAKKRLKSGKQIRLLDGPAAGKRCNSFSKAMLMATARQRREQKLGRKGASNGWIFWSWPGKVDGSAENESYA